MKVPKNLRGFVIIKCLFENRPQISVKFGGKLKLHKFVKNELNFIQNMLSPLCREVLLNESGLQVFVVLSGSRHVRHFIVGSKTARV